MIKQDFFRCKDMIVHTAESLMTYITSVLPDLQDNYILGDIVIGRSDSSYVSHHFPMVFLPITAKAYPDLKEVVVYLPEVDILATCVGKVSFSALGLKDVGRSFDVIFDDGAAKGEIGMRGDEICLIYHKDL